MAAKARQLRNDSSMDSANLIPLSDIESIVRPIVQKAIDAAAEVLRTEFLKLLDDRITQLEQTVDTLTTEYMKVDIAALETKVQELDNKLSQLQLPVTNSSNSVEDLRKDNNETKLWANENEQYSRRLNIRIRGLVLPVENCDYRQEVINFFKTKLQTQNIGIHDIDAAHPIYSSGSATASRDGNARQNQPVILVRFYHKEHRDYVLKQWRKLKGTYMTISEDLTTLNVQTMNRAKNNTQYVSKTWSWNCKIYALLHSGKMVIVKPFQRIQEAEEIGRR